MAREGFRDEVIFEQRLDEVKAEPCEHMVEGHLGRRNSKCRVLHMGAFLVYSSHSNEASMAGEK